ncbi:response regulator transcription factor [Staphylococcus hominis]|uniref:response regulator transcription factor n=1 Tax=Staphylococcus hominis TaxID=1290 RepID=UPI001F5A5AF7|nr:response regulator transcription factor [Staphylococcus hominis]MCI2902507.1 response regulator transcription factor [Staphylococcus hominis]
MNNYYILIVEDDKSIANLLAQILDDEGFNTTIDNDGHIAQTAFSKFHLIVMDIMLPNNNGLEIAKKIRSQNDMPIIFLTARLDLDSKYNGLDIGNDYLEKPFEPIELIMRIKNLILMFYGPALYELFYLKIDQINRSVYLDEKEIKFTKTELNLFFYLFENRNRTLTKEQIMDKIWPFGSTFDSVLNVYINRIRSKIQDHENNIIKNSYGLGYSLVTKEG